jgi:uncharacterized membrane protein HdeD (DUF308 family)
MNKQPDPNYLWGVILIAIGVVFLIDTFLPPLGFINDLIWAAVFAASGLLVYNAYTRRKERWWMLIPAYALVAIAGVIVLDALFPRAEDLSGAYVMFAIALPFLYVYLNDKKKWWALIPGGIMAAVGLGLLVSAVVAFLPVLLILAGVYLLVRQISENRSKTAASAPKTGPEADKPAEQPVRELNGTGR